MADYPRETVEYQTVTVTIDGTPVYNGVAFSVVPQTGNTPARPDTFTPAIIVGNTTAILIDGYTPGQYRVWAQVTAQGTPEIPVIDCGILRVT